MAKPIRTKAYRPRVSVLILDLDDTLWDWVKIWHEPFKAMLDSLLKDEAAPRETLLTQFKEVFTKHNTSEYAFALEEMPCLEGQDQSKEKATEAYRDVRRKVLALYPTVPETLAAIRGKGTIIVGYTESKAFYASYRIRKLGLDGVLDFLYSPEDDDLPSGIRAEDIRKYPPSHYKLLRTIHRHTPRGIAKPSPDVLTAIIKEIGAEQTQVAYVGDKLFKDIAMAQDAGVIDLWAKYGDARQSSEYELLKAVTHWPQAMVEKERATKASELKPSYVLEKDFSEILEHLEFVAHVNTGEESVKRVLEIWKKTVDVQQHFNDLCLRIRNYAISVYVTIIGAAGLAIKERWNVSLPRGINFPVSSLFFFAGAVAMLMFGYMDRDWYHRLLYGAVKHSMWLEERYARILPELGLSKTIKDESPASFFFWNIHAASKLLIFYLFLFLSLVALGAACIFTYS